MDSQKAKVILTGEEALEKFLAGKEVWNAYVKQYPEADVDFSGVDFSKHRKEANRRLYFSGYLFPLKGDVYFTRARFGEGNVPFHKATFGEGVVDFRYSKFGEGLEHFGNGFLYAIAQIIPFVAAGRESSKESITALFGDDAPNWVFAISLAQGLTSFLLIFLIGLALRNRFRI